MSIEAIRQVTETEQANKQSRAAAEAEARQLVLDAERNGTELLKQVRSDAAEQGKDLLRQAEDALTARELIKGKVLETAPFTSREAAEPVAGAAAAEVVQVIGRTFVLYRRNPKEPKIELPKG